MTPVERVLERLQGVRRNGDGWQALCPAHADRDPSLSVREGDGGKVLIYCHVGCTAEAIVQAIGLELRDLFAHDGRRDGKGGGGTGIPPNDDATAQPSGTAGCTLEHYAAAKRLPASFLRGLGLSDMTYLGTPAVRIPYMDRDGTETAVRFRLALAKGDGADNRFRWRKGDTPSLYGLWRLEGVRAAVRHGYITLVEGESDCHTGWYHDVPMLGVPGANSWREHRDAAHLDDIPIVYVIREPDRGGDALLEYLAALRVREQLRIVSLGGFKDVSGLYLDDPARFLERWRAALEAAVPWAERAAAEADAHRRAAWERCASLARLPRILDAFADTLRQSGVVGERRPAQTLYLIVTSRLLARPGSAAVKSPSSAGKSYLVEKVLGFFPPSAYYALSAMSERALAYSEEPLSHRMLVIYEAAGLRGDFASYLVRSLLSEGRVRYETVEKTKDGLRPKLIEREGPTGLLVTTTAVSLHPENETRLLSIPVTDTPEQTRNVLLGLADEAGRPAVDFGPWHALQAWIEGGPTEVAIPWALALATLIPPLAVRLRRDVGAVLTLIRAHALLHQASRDTDEAGRIIATLDDYAAVCELVCDLVADGVEATVTATVRETVGAVSRLVVAGASEVTVAALAKALGVDKATALRRSRVAIDRGYLKNLEDKPRRPARLVLGEPLPEDVAILPTVEALVERLQGCTVAGETEGIGTPPSPHLEDVTFDAAEEELPW